jgi:hypothetical protein
MGSLSVILTTWKSSTVNLGGGPRALACRDPPQRALLAVAVGIAGTWGVMAVWMLAISERRVSSVIVLCYVIASLALAFVLDQSRSWAKREEN